MSHRTALAASIALTLILAFGIVAGRDRLLGSAATASSAGTPPPPTPAATVDSGATRTVGTDRRIIEIPLPMEPTAPTVDAAARGASERWEEDDDGEARGDRRVREDDDRSEGDDDDGYEGDDD